MIFSGLPFKAKTAALAALTMLACLPAAVHAQNQPRNSIFPEGWDSNMRSRMFMRLGYVSLHTRTSSGEARDVTGPVVTAADLTQAAAYGDSLPSTDPLSPDNFDQGPGSYGLGAGAITAEVRRLGGLGTPKGIKARAGNASTLAVSVGYWLSDEYTWAVEAYLLAAPLRVSAYGDGVNYSGQPNGLNGKKILTSKLLPPLAILAYYFGDKDSVVRPYAGVGATYAIFFDTKVTNAFTDYIGGGNTTASLKNALGVGPFLGAKAQVTDDWHVNLSVGYVRLRTEATLTTSNTHVVTGAGVLNDYSALLKTAIARGENNFDSQFTTKLLQVLERSRGTSDLGTFVRKQNTAFSNTIVNLSVGTSF